ncbi:MAG: hypothetical protein HGA87_07270 [Desulfobulbaceae bacterium]|nr:hypothetical protein [Desulfobulbaceae bacterium]
MASTSETGHAKNAANFELLLTYVSSLGTAYNPTKAALKLAAMQTQLTSAKNSITAINAAYPAYANATAAREAAFAPLSKLVTRIGNALKATDASNQVIDNANTIIRKLQGRRATQKSATEPPVNPEATATEPKTVSASQMGYDNRLDNFDKLVKLLASIPQYAPNEADLKVAALTTLYNDLKAKNLAVITTEAPLINARIARNGIFYTDNTGVVDISTDVKLYIKSIYGATSEQYKAISGLKFNKYRR